MTPFTYKYQAINTDGKYIWLQKAFKSQADLFRYLVEENELIVSQKKSIQKRAEGGLSLVCNTADELSEGATAKAIKPLYENNNEEGILKRTLVINTYWWMDSHSDVHLGRGAEGDKAVFTNSIKTRVNKVYPIDQHKWDLDGRIGKTIALYEAPISWRALGVSKTGMTEALFAEAEIMKARNEARYNDYLNDEIDQHSVGMYYLDIQTAINDKENYPKQYEVYQKYIPKIGNKQQAENQGYFFAVGEAKLVEYSCVIAGSNELTPVMGVSSQPSGDTGNKSETSGGIHKQAVKAKDILKYLSTQNNH